MASQATSLAAALLSCARPAAKAHWIGLVQGTLAAIAELAAAGIDVPLHRVGALHVACGDAGRAALADTATASASLGVRSDAVVPKDFSLRLPWLDLSRFDAAQWYPDEAFTDPYLLASAYATAARRLGVRFEIGADVRLIRQGDGANALIGDRVLAPETIWITCGAWSGALLAPLGIGLAQGAVRSQYWISGGATRMPADMPMLLAPDLRLYARPELGSVLFGLRETGGKACRSAAFPDDLDGFQFDAADGEGYRSLEANAASLATHAPGLTNMGLRHYVSGPSCYTPDGDFLVGRLGGAANVCVLAGCNGAGIAASAGLADLAAGGEASPDAGLPARLAPDRFGQVDADGDDFLARCIAARAGKCSA